MIVYTQQLVNKIIITLNHNVALQLWILKIKANPHSTNFYLLNNFSY